MTRLPPELPEASDQPRIISLGSNMSGEDDDLHKPFDYMPQTPAPMMFMSAATGSTRKNVNDRALRLLNLTMHGRQVDEAFSGAMDANGYGLPEHLDINKLPPTPPFSTNPPSTSSTPTADTSAAPTCSSSSVSGHLKLAKGVRITTRAGCVLAACIVFICTATITLVVLDYKEGAEKARCVVPVLGLAAKAVSHGLEVGIQAVGWLCGRTVARFGRGFERGYTL